jgi:hypothetical protein
MTKVTDIRTGDQKVDRALDEVRRPLNRALESPFLGARFVEVTLPDATPVRIRHGVVHLGDARGGHRGIYRRRDEQR